MVFVILVIRVTIAQETNLVSLGLTWLYKINVKLENEE